MAEVYLRVVLFRLLLTCFMPTMFAFVFPKSCCCAWAFSFCKPMTCGCI